jgi:alpha-galactosidase
VAACVGLASCAKREGRATEPENKPVPAAGSATGGRSGAAGASGGVSPPASAGNLGGTTGGIDATTAGIADASIVDAPAPAPAASARVKVTFDGELRRQLVWKGAEKASVLVSDPATQAGIRVDGGELSAFVADPTKSRSGRAVDPELGPGEETVAVGLATRASDGVRVIREARAFVPDGNPDTVVLRSTFRNAGTKRLHVQRVTAERVLLDRALGEPGQPSHAFASYQGAAYAWGKDYTVIPLTPGFRRANFMGQDDPQGSEGIGGGMPLVDLWGRAMGVAVAHIEKGPRWVSLPVEVRADGRVEVALTETPQERLGQKEWLEPGDAYETVTTALIFHKGDYFAALAAYGDLLRARGVAIPRESPVSAHEPYWKSWGFRKDVTVDKFMAVLPELKAMGIRTANLDDGWFDFHGDWQPNRAAGKFPGGAPDLIRFVERVHAEGFRTALWWYPIGAHVDSRLAKERRDLLVLDERGQPTKDVDGYYQLCPAHEPARRYVRDTLRRFIKDWGFDGVYLDFDGLSAVPACFNPAHKHQSPLDGFEQLPTVFAEISADLHALKSDPFLEVCVCAVPHSPYIMPYYPLANASDPRSNAQARQRVKAEKAIRGPRFAVGDAYQVPADEWTGTSLKEAFETAMGVGAGLTTFYADLDGRQRTLWQRWFGQYRDLGLGSGEYLNLYDVAFDLPEGHVVRRGTDLYYGFFAANWPATQKIELRGLDPGTRYEVFDYGRNVALATISGATPFVTAGFTDNLLLRVRPIKAP